MDKSTPFGVLPNDFLNLTWILFTSSTLDNKLGISEAGNRLCVKGENLMSFFEPKLEKVKEGECFVEVNNEKDDSITNIVPHSMVEFLDLQDVYEKVQSRAGGGSAQRISMGTVNITAISDGQLCGIDVFVQRLPEAAALCGDTNGKVALKVTYESHFQNQQSFSVDLDSVYHSSNGTPVYKLSTVDAERRNRFVLIVVLTFIDGTTSEPFASKPFLIRSRKPRSRNQSIET